jgi:hypothetical protein
MNVHVHGSLEEKKTGHAIQNFLSLRETLNKRNTSHLCVLYTMSMHPVHMHRSPPVSMMYPDSGSRARNCLDAAARLAAHAQEECRDSRPTSTLTFVFFFSLSPAQVYKEAEILTSYNAHPLSHLKTQVPSQPQLQTKLM